MYTLPKEIAIDGKTFSIRNQGDYRVILDVIAAMQDPELSNEEHVIAALMIFYEDINSIEDLNKLGDIKAAAEEMNNFIECGGSETGCDTHIKLIDWEQDEKLICSAVNAVAGTEVRALPYLHWYTFIGYYMAIGECALATVVNIRNKRARGKKLEKYEQEFYRHNPQYFYWKSEQKQTEDIISKFWED